jgi:polyhydroxyalkanoate synthase
VAPWRSVHKITFHPATDVTFLLTSGGHNAGIVSEPGRKNSHYRVSAKQAGEHYVDPDTWLEQTSETAGSWWPEWEGWLSRQSSGRVKPPVMVNGARSRAGALPDAPGRYVLQP